MKDKTAHDMPDELWICRRKTHLPEHDGATGYFYYEPVEPLKPATDDTRTQTDDAREKADPIFPREIFMGRYQGGFRLWMVHEDQKEAVSYTRTDSLSPRPESKPMTDSIANLLTDVAQILDVVKTEWGAEKFWSDWDQGVRDRIASALKNHVLPAKALTEAEVLEAVDGIGWQESLSGYWYFEDNGDLCAFAYELLARRTVDAPQVVDPLFGYQPATVRQLQKDLTECHISAFINGDSLSKEDREISRSFIFKTLVSAAIFVECALESRATPSQGKAS